MNDFENDRRAEIAHHLRQGFAVQISERDYAMLRASRYIERDFTIHKVFSYRHGYMIKIWYH